MNTQAYTRSRADHPAGKGRTGGRDEDPTSPRRGLRLVIPSSADATGPIDEAPRGANHR